MGEATAVKRVAVGTQYQQALATKSVGLYCLL